MLIGINQNYQIKQIREITDTTLTQIEIDETQDFYQFKNWSDTKILCYCYKQTEHEISIYPYIDINIIEKIEQDSIKIQGLNAQIATTQEAVDFLLMGGM